MPSNKFGLQQVSPAPAHCSLLADWHWWSHAARLVPCCQWLYLNSCSCLLLFARLSTHACVPTMLMPICRHLQAQHASAVDFRTTPQHATPPQFPAAAVRMYC